MLNVKGFKFLTCLFILFYVVLCNGSVLNEDVTKSIIMNGIKGITNIGNIIKFDNVINYNFSFIDGKAKADLFLNITQLIHKYGYSVEEYKVTTKDGYILKVFRIPGRGPAVFLMHGIADSADSWVTPGGDTGVAFLLAARGYDVWLGNQRGNRHSLNHTKLNSYQAEFWNFSWHEIGLYDLTASIDFVLEKTNTSSLIYIGHSQGTTSFFVMCSLMPEYNKKISLMVSFAPIAWVSNIQSPVKLLSKFVNEISDVLKTLGIYELFAHDTHLPFETALCSNTLTAYFICQLVQNLFGGFNFAQVNIHRLPVIFRHFPTGVSIKQLEHYLQLIESGHFRQYDYKLLNMEKYDLLSPPSYPVENVIAPIAILHGEGDFLSVRKDVNKLVTKLGNLVEFYTISDKKFQHFDFLLSKDIKISILPKLIELIEKYKSP